MSGGKFGRVCIGATSALIDDLILKADRDTNRSHETTEHVDVFETDGGGYGVETLVHDAAGNLTYDGVYAYTYDAWNRLARVNPV